MLASLPFFSLTPDIAKKKKVLGPKVVSEIMFLFCCIQQSENFIYEIQVKKKSIFLLKKYVFRRKNVIEPKVIF